MSFFLDVDALNARIVGARLRVRRKRWGCASGSQQKDQNAVHRLAVSRGSATSSGFAPGYSIT